MKEAFTDTVRESTREVLRTLKKKETVDLYIQQLRSKGDRRQGTPRQPTANRGWPQLTA